MDGEKHRYLPRHSKLELPPLGDSKRGAFNGMFFYRQRRTFLTAKGRFFYRCGCCRHAVHDGGDGGDDKEENSFSDGQCHQRHPGEAASSCYGFLCFWYHLI